MLRRALELEKEINLVQKSTRTLLSFFIPVHNWLRMKSRLYYVWSLQPYSRVVHWVILALYIGSLPFALFSYYSPRNVETAKATTYDFPRWEWSNPKPTGNGIRKITECNQDSSLWTIGDRGTILKSTDIGNNWAQQYNNANQDLKDIVCISPSNIIAIGASGTIIQYDGISWTARTSGTSSYLRGMTVLDSTHIVVVGETGAITVSADAGQTWTAQTKGATQFYDVASFGSADTIAVGNNGTIAVSTDAGQTWNTKTSGTTQWFNEITFLDSIHVVAVGGASTIIVSTDGGQTWTPKTSGTTQWLRSVGAIDSTHAVAVGNTGAITVSTDGGQTWAVKTSGTTQWIQDAIFLTPNRVIATGGTSAITISTDTGQTWAMVSNGTVNPLASMAILDSTHAVAVGNNGTIAVSTDAGQTWNTKTSGTGNYLKSVTKFDSTHAVAVGDLGTIVVSTDGGQTWAPKTSGTGNYLQKVITLNSTHAIAVGYGGAITVSTDGGQTWAVKTSNTSGNLLDVIAADLNNIIAVGTGMSEGTIVVSTDGGQTWAVKTSGTTNQWLNSVIVLDPTHIVAVGSAGNITVSTDSGQTWAVKTSGTTREIHSTISFDSTHVIAVGDSGTITVSTDGGQTWAVKTSGTTDNLYRIAFFGPTQATAVGATGAVVVSTDMGQSWITQTKVTTYQLNDVAYFDSNNITAIGTTGTILRYYSPANATATKTLVKLPGQYYDANSGSFGGTPTSVRTGQSVTATIHAVDNSNVLDKGNASTIGFTTTDPADSNPAPVQLTQGGTCVQSNRQAGDPECGIGTASFTFHTAGTWTITASDTNSVLSAGTSSSITVTAGSPTQLYPTSTSTSTTAGVSSGALTLGLKDTYGNGTSAESDIAVTLSSSASNGRFSTSTAGPWTSTLTPTISNGAGSTTFYYLNYTAESSTITATASGLTSTTISVATSAGPVDTVNSTCSLSTSSVTADNTEATVNSTLVNIVGGVTNKLSGKTVAISSSRSEDTISQPSAVTDSNGQASGTIKSTKAGQSTVTCKDETDGVFLSTTPSLTFNHGPVASLSVESAQETVAGSFFSLKTTLLDRYGNTASNSFHTLSFSSTDSQATLPASHQLLSGDGGVHTFSDIILKTAGSKTITINDDDMNISKSITLNVLPSSYSKETSSFASTKSKLIINKDSATLKATVLDGYGNSLSEKEISILYNSSYGDLKVKIGKTGTSGIGEFEFTPKKEGKVVFSAYNETDKTAIGTSVTIEVLSDTVVNNIVAGISSVADQGKEAAKSAAKAVSLLVDALQESKPATIVAEVAKNVVAATASLGLIPIIANIVGSAPAAVHVVNYGISLTLEALGFTRRRRSWGRVYDSTTGKGIDMALVRLFDQHSMKLVSTVVTDIRGRYSFQPEPGVYAVSVSKDNYVFPTAIFAQYKVGIINKDPSLTNKHYVGQPISIERANNLINIDIPIDPHNKKPTTLIKVKVFLNDLFDSLTIGLSRIFFPALVFGFMLSAFATIVIPETKNLIISGIYTVIALTYVVSRAIKSSHYGIVYDRETKEPINNAVVSIFDNEYGSLKETRISDKYGRFSILAQPGTYKLKVEKEGYSFSSQKTKESSPLRDRKIKNPYTGGSFSLKSAGFIKYSVSMDKK